VTIQQSNGEGVILKIEGKVLGPQFPVLSRTWQELAPTLGARKLCLDLRGVTHVGNRGLNLLSEIHDQTGAEFLADTPLTKYFAEEAQQGNRTRSEH
jgi:anti-anti-sigma regulatory factor